MTITVSRQDQNNKEVTDISILYNHTRNFVRCVYNSNVPPSKLVTVKFKREVFPISDSKMKQPSKLL